MSSHHLEYLLAPQSLAVIGASDRPGSVGATVMRNVLSGGFRGDMAFVAVGADAAGAEEILGVARARADPDNDAAEFAVLVRSDLKGHGLGTLLMRKLIRYCRERGTRELRGDVLSDNFAMLHLSRSLGFCVRATEQNVESVALDLQAQPAARLTFERGVCRPLAPQCAQITRENGRRGASLCGAACR